MKALITGVAGFIGSTLADALLARGDHVLGVDCFTPYYERHAKEANLVDASRCDRFELAEADLRTCDIDAMLDGVDVVFHQAGQPGVRLSWSDGFADYSGLNILATQRLLEAAKRCDNTKIVYASSSSVYGNAAAYPTSEEDLPRPHSPYGVTKLAAEHLCNLYALNWKLPTVSLRYFTVYGPRQRPDMATHRLIAAAIAGTTFPLYGDGTAVRDFTYVDDAVAANIAAADHDCEPGTVVNIAGGSSITMAELIALVGDVVGQPPGIDRQPGKPGDVARTGGTIDRAAALLDWKPNVDLRSGLAAQASWHRERAREASLR
jgi:nucleoside-diphosphate-sugar epimerase